MRYGVFRLPTTLICRSDTLTIDQYQISGRVLLNPAFFYFVLWVSSVGCFPSERGRELRGFRVVSTLPTGTTPPPNSPRTTSS